MLSSETAYRVLVVDDSEDDVELVRRELTRGGVACQIARVDDERGLVAALRGERWDMVIADYSLPGFGARAVLKLLHARGSDLPCIVISGVAGEDRAVVTMREGARDFVSKDRLHRLAPAVQRELEENAVRRERANEAREEREREIRMRNASTELLGLLRSDAFWSGDPAPALSQITELVAAALSISRVSIWLRSRCGQVLECHEEYDVSTGHHRGESYRVVDHPAYFQALEQNRLVEAHHTGLDGRPHPQPNGGVVSQLDAAVRLRGETVGALCLDHVGLSRRWRSDEQVFVASIADLLALLLETSERRRAELALRESETRYRELWASALDGIYTLDPLGRLTSANEAGAKMLGVDAAEVVGRHFSDFVADGDVARTIERFEQVVNRTLLGGPFAFRATRGDGAVVEVEATVQRVEHDGCLMEFLAIVRDVTQRRELEAQLQQAQRMEAVGRLARGVAHDFNNLLTAIIGYARMAEGRSDVPESAQTDLREIASAAKRAASLSRQLLAFSRRQVLQPQSFNLNDIVRGMRGLLVKLVGDDIQLEISLADELAHVLADPTQFEQVLLNLAVNARDAMPKGGTLGLTTRMSNQLEPGVLKSGDAKETAYVLLEVTDTGTGMSDETRLRIFEPFFTTKPLGTGLGLSTVYGIVQQSGGAIGVTTAPGKGARFSVYLPALGAAASRVDTGAAVERVAGAPLP